MKRLPKGLSIVSIGDIKVAKLYDTNIVQINSATKRLTLRTGGWQTKHTKKCINLVLNPLGLFLVQKNFNWKLYRNGTLVGLFKNDTLEVSL